MDLALPGSDGLCTQAVQDRALSLFRACERRNKNTQIKVPEDFFDDQAMRGYVAPSCNLHDVPPVARSSGKAHRLYFSTTIMDIDNQSDPQTGFCSA